MRMLYLTCCIMFGATVEWVVRKMRFSYQGQVTPMEWVELKVCSINNTSIHVETLTCI